MERENDMTREKAQSPSRQVSSQELDAQQVAELPERAALSIVNANAAAAICAALGLNVASDSSAAIAAAYQYAPVYQHN